MALKRWRWIWGPLLVAAVVAVAALPPSVASPRGLLAALGLAYTEWNYPAGTVHRRAVRAAVIEQRKRARESRLADSILAMTRGARVLRSPDGAVTVVYESPIGADSARVWLRAASAELQLYPKSASGGVPVIVALLSDLRRRAQQGDNLTSGPTYRLFGAATRDRGCIVAVNLVEGGRARYALILRHSGEPLGRYLDICALEGRLGAPGPAVARWFGRVDWFWQPNQLTGRLLEAQRPINREIIARSGEAPYWYGQMPWVAIGCLDGSPALCARATGIERDGRSARGNFAAASRMLVSYLALHGTPVQLADFWRSPLSVGDALHAAYQRPAGELAGAALGHWYAVAPEAGRSGAAVLLAGLFWAVAALIFAVAAGRRWQTEV
jgi:hypothetical protein